MPGAHSSSNHALTLISARYNPSPLERLFATPPDLFGSSPPYPSSTTKYTECLDLCTILRDLFFRAPIGG